MIGAIFVLYNPDIQISERINFIANYVSKVYVVDNSPRKVELNIHNDIRSKVNHYFLNKNMGIAAALNIGCEYAINDNLLWAFTMDQDSDFFDFDIDSLNKDIISSNENIGLYFPNVYINNELYDNYFYQDSKPLVVMTSGNILNLSVHKKLGGFDEKLFIDYVDVEYCLRLKANNYQIEKLPNLKINHSLGNSVLYKIFNTKIWVTNHNYIRRYYITRNRFYIQSVYKIKFSKFCSSDFKVFINDFFKIILFENFKFSKLKYMILAIRDFKNNNYRIIDF